MPLKHLTNTHDPKDEKTAKMQICLTHNEMSDPNGHEKAWQRHLQYLEGKIIGPPASWHDDSDEELLSKANLIPIGILDRKGTLLEQVKRFQATTPTVEQLVSRKMVGVYVEVEEEAA